MRATEGLCCIPKTKRQQWWKSQSLAEKQAYLQKKLDQKAEFRRKRSLAIMRKHKDEYSCSDCIHGLTKSCDDNLLNACERWANPNSDKQGLLALDPKLYKKQPHRDKKECAVCKNTRIRTASETAGCGLPVRQKPPKALKFEVPRCIYA